MPLYRVLFDRVDETQLRPTLIAPADGLSLPGKSVFTTNVTVEVFVDVSRATEQSESLIAVAALAHLRTAEPAGQWQLVLAQP